MEDKNKVSIDIGLFRRELLEKACREIEKKKKEKETKSA